MDLKTIVLQKVNENLANTYYNKNFNKISDDDASQIEDCIFMDLDTMQPFIEKINNQINLDIIAQDLAMYQLTEHDQTDFEYIILGSEEDNYEKLESDLKLDADISNSDIENIDLCTDDEDLQENLKIASDINVSKLPDVSDSLSFQMIKERLERNSMGNSAVMKTDNVLELEESNMVDLDKDTIQNIINDLERNNVAVKRVDDGNLLESENCINDVDKDIIQNLMRDELMDLDLADLNLSGPEDSEDITQTDMESLIKVHQIFNKNKKSFNATLDILDSGKVEIEITPYIIDKSNQDRVENSFSNISITLSDSDSECDGYHSSDFEFITESEAKLELLVTNKTKNKMKRTTSTKISHNRIDGNIVKTAVVEKNKPGPSSMNEPIKNQDTLKYWSRTFNISLRVDQYKKDEKYNRENHTIPQGEDFFNLFRGNQTPGSVLFENKSIIPSACMQVQRSLEFSHKKYEDGKDLDDKTLKEAEANAKMILAKYPKENRKRSLRSTSRWHSLLNP